MTSTETLASRRAVVDPAELCTPGAVDQLDATVAACALVAQADGWVTPEEARQMLARMRGSPTLAFFGAEEPSVLFDALNVRFETDLDEAEALAEATVARLRGRPEIARQVIETACAVAEADGGFDAAERETVLRLCQMLNVDPASVGLMAPGTRGGLTS
ncbi:MAG: TerB family tellurite resistance protein [Caulobacteraceae bacterium]|nr:TerB family tellurite resistance protein [Caulobacteraceae bacterium]